MGRNFHIVAHIVITHGSARAQICLKPASLSDKQRHAKGDEVKNSSVGLSETVSGRSRLVCSRQWRVKEITRGSVSPALALLARGNIMRKDMLGLLGREEREKKKERSRGLQRPPETADGFWGGVFTRRGYTGVQGGRCRGLNLLSPQTKHQ